MNRPMPISGPPWICPHCGQPFYLWDATTITPLVEARTATRVNAWVACVACNTDISLDLAAGQSIFSPRRLP